MNAQKKDHQQDRRKHKRYEVNLQVEYSSGNKFSTDFARNISHGGIFIHTTKPLDPGTIVNLRFHIPGKRLPIRLKGEVRWSVKQEDVKSRTHIPGMGIKFIDLTPRKIARIRNFIARLQKESEEV